MCITFIKLVAPLGWGKLMLSLLSLHHKISLKKVLQDVAKLLAKPLWASCSTAEHAPCASCPLVPPGPQGWLREAPAALGQRCSGIKCTGQALQTTCMCHAGPGLHLSLSLEDLQPPCKASWSSGSLGILSQGLLTHKWSLWDCGLLSYNNNGKCLSKKT